MKNKWTGSMTLMLLAAAVVVFTGCKKPFPKTVLGTWKTECLDKSGNNTHPDVTLYWIFEVDPTGGMNGRFVQQEVDSGGGSTYGEGTYMYMETAGVLQIQDPTSGSMGIYNLIELGDGSLTATGIGETCTMINATTVTSVPAKN